MLLCRLHVHVVNQNSLFSTSEDEDVAPSSLQNPPPGLQSPTREYQTATLINNNPTPNDDGKLNPKCISRFPTSSPNVSVMSLYICTSIRYVFIENTHPVPLAILKKFFDSLQSIIQDWYQDKTHHFLILVLKLTDLNKYCTRTIYSVCFFLRS